MSLPGEDSATMRAAVLVEPGRFEIQKVPLPLPGAGQVRIKIESCGVCASNLSPWKGRPWFNYPFPAGALGHEATGIIDLAGPNMERWQPGTRVAALTYNSYAEYDLAESGNLMALPAALESRPFPGEPLACAMNIFRRSGIQSGQTVAIIGAGFLGGLLVQLAIHQGVKVIALSQREYSLKIAEGLGAIPVSSADRYAAINRVKEIVGEKLCPVVVEATGCQEPLHLAGELVSEGGRLVIAGYHQDGLREINLQQWNWKGIDVINAHERDPAMYVQGMHDALQAVLENRMNPTPLLTHVLPLKQLNEAMRLTDERPAGFVKALVVP